MEVALERTTTSSDDQLPTDARMQRFLSILVLAVATAALVAAAPAPTVVGEEECVAGVDAEEVASPDWVDLCTLAFGGDASELVVRVTTVGSIEDRPAPAHYGVSWTAGDCRVTLYHADQADGGAFDDLEGRCGGGDQVECTPAPLPVDCLDAGPVVVDVAIDPPTADGTTLTWRLRFTGELAPLATAHASGAQIQDAFARAATSTSAAAEPMTYRSGSSTPEACVGGTCTSPLDDRLDAERAYTIQ